MSEPQPNLTFKPSIPFAIWGGLISSFAGAAIWALITIATEYQHAYMAIAVGLLAGFSVRFFGLGGSLIFKIIGALFALISCLLGNVSSIIGFYVLESGLNINQSLLSIDYLIVLQLLFEYTEPIDPAMDALFYIIAIYLGFKVSSAGIISFKYRSRDIIIPAMNKEFDSKTININSFGERPIYPKNRIYILGGITSVIIIFLASFFSSTNGVQTYYYPNGNKNYAGVEQMGIPEGLWTYWYEDGTIMSEINFEKGFLHGSSKNYYPNGTLYSEMNYYHNMLDGMYFEYSELGNTLVSGQYKNDRAMGHWQYFYDNGQVFQEGSSFMDKEQGIWKSYYENGRIASQGNYEYGTQDGEWKYFNESGDIIRELIFNKGILKFRNVWDAKGVQQVKNGNGVLREYYDNGNLIFTVAIMNSSQNGQKKVYTDDGRLYQVFSYENGVEYLINYWDEDNTLTVSDGNGFIRLYYESGQLLSEEYYKNGLKHITAKIWDEDGSLLGERHYLDGKLHGPSTQFSIDGILILKGEFKDNEQIGLWQWFDEYDGSITSEVEFINGKKEGNQTFWSYGIKIKEEVYKDGEYIKTILF